MSSIRVEAQLLYLVRRMALLQVLPRILSAQLNQRPEFLSTIMAWWDKVHWVLFQLYCFYEPEFGFIKGELSISFKLSIFSSSQASQASRSLLFTVAHNL